MKNLICMAEGDGGNGIILIIVMLAFLALIFISSFLPQKKRQKEMMNMLNSIKVGDEIKTIGGMVGVITEIEETGLLVINVGTVDAPTFIKIDRVAIYSVAKKPEDAIQTVEQAPVVEEMPIAEEKVEEKENN